MADPVVIYMAPGHQRSKTVCHAMLEGIRRVGDPVVLMSAASYRTPDAPVAIFYGLSGNLGRCFREYRKAPGMKAVYIDLGYWGRRASGRFNGYHKISVNNRHPTAYFQKRRHDDSRLAALGLELQPWRKPGRHILLAGMGPKAARCEGFASCEWERATIAKLRAVTDRPILYRPKPNWPGARPLPGAEFDRTYQTGGLEPVLQDAHAVVTHHSNVGVEALQFGVPVFTEAGVATPMASGPLTGIEKPKRPSTRKQWLADVSWCQWSVAEMREGLAWRYLKDENLVP